MRQLSNEELELVAGGIPTLDRVVVTATGFYGNMGYTWMGHATTEINVSESYWGEGGGGSGGEAPPELPCKSQEPWMIDNYLDQIASTVTRTIKAMPDYNRREYISLAYRDTDGVIRWTEPVAGAANGQSATIDLAALGITGFQLLGVIHNHPRDVYSSSAAEEAINRFPSNNDWATADQIIQAGASITSLQLYVIGPDGGLRQYPYADKNNFLNPNVNSRPPGKSSEILTAVPCN